MNTQFDLFGNKVRRKRTKFELILSDKDNSTLSARAARLKYLHERNPDGILLAGDLEFVMTYRELQEAFINGHFLSVIILGQAWIEKIIHVHLESIGKKSITKKGIFEMIKFCQENEILDSFMSSKLDRFRKIRNPIAHWKPRSNEYSLHQRSWKNKRNPEKQLESDAREIIMIAGHMIKYGLN